MYAVRHLIMSHGWDSSADQMKTSPRMLIVAGVVVSGPIYLLLSPGAATLYAQNRFRVGRMLKLRPFDFYFGLIQIRVKLISGMYYMYVC